MADIGHNSGADVLTGAAQGRLRTIIERVERLEEDKAAIAADIKEVYAEAQYRIGEDEEWLEAVASWERAGKPRSQKDAK